VTSEVEPKVVPFLSWSSLITNLATSNQTRLISKVLLVTQPRAGTSHNEILALQVAAHQKGWDVLPAPPGWRLDDDLIKSGVKGVPYGSQTFCEVIAMQMNWTLKANSFDWLARVPKDFLKRKVEFMTLGEAKKIQETKFIKPADDKVFPAKVYAPGTLIVSEVISDDTPTLVSDVVEFDLEYRCFVHTGGIVTTWSNYICYDHIAEPDYWDMVPIRYSENKLDRMLPWEFVQELCRSHIVTAPSVVDVGRIKGKGWAIIETNQAWASGIYGCDPDGVLDVLEDSCETHTPQS